MLEILILSITSFIGTNIDDFIIDIFFFSAAENKKDMVRVVLGKYLGISILVLISLIGALGLEIMPVQHIEVLGFVPIGLGIKEIFSSMWENEEDNQNMPSERNRILKYKKVIVPGVYILLGVYILNGL